MTAPDQRLDEIQARLAAVKEGPWELFSFGATDVRFLLAELRKAHGALARAWDEGATAGLGWDENRETDFTTPNPYRAAVAAANGDAQ